MILITAHTNADFDALAGMAAAELLYPGARLLFPTTAEPILHRYFEEHRDRLPPAVTLKEFDPKDVERLVCVDVSVRNRLGETQFLLDRNPPIPVDVYDHHPGEADIISEHQVIRESGACTTVLIEILRERGLKANPFLATLFLLGIYEDTGYLTFPTTRPADLEAARLCLEWGGDLQEVSRRLSRRLTEAQLRVLAKLVENMESVMVGGIEVKLTTFSSSQYIPDLSVLVHELTALEDLDVFFLLAYLENRIHIIARSRHPAVDVGRVLEAFGGGGPPSAASAQVRERTLEETRRLLIEELTRKHPVGLKASDVFQRDFHVLEADTTVTDAFKAMNRRHVNALPVFRKGALCGVITRQEVDGAMLHGLGDSTVMELVASRPPLFPSDTSLEVVRRAMMERNLRIALFGNDPEHVEGLISRMALFKSLFLMDQSVPQHRGGGIPSREEISRLLDASFSQATLAQLRRLGALSAKTKAQCLLVGGAVRDLLLRRPIKDMDFVVEGDAIALAEAWSREQGGRVRCHREFGTAVWMDKDDQVRWDFATARAEYYETPAALPTVVSAALSQDLYRRDFTFNTLALHLEPGKFGKILDLFGGVRDLKTGQIRVMHGLSFVEDPTRAFRAARFAVRLSFTIPSETRALIASALRHGVFRNLSHKRVLAEVRQILDGEFPAEGLRTLQKFDLLQVFWPSFHLTSRGLEKMYRVQKVLDFFDLHFPSESLDRPTLFLMALTERLSNQDLNAFIRRYPFSRATRQLLQQYRSMTWHARQALGSPDRTPGRVYLTLKDKPLEWILYLAARTEGAAQQGMIRDYLTHHRFVRIEITGNDLKREGIPPSNAYAEALDQTRAARIDGRVKGPREELEFALAVASGVLNDS
ncbi:MAG: CBS domain-containing protein [Acidobacteriota bacterium]